MRAEFDDGLQGLPAEQRMRIETRLMVIMAHGVHMLARYAPPPHLLGQLSEQVLRVTGIPAAACYHVGDFERLSEAALPDPLARQKLESLWDLLWHAAVFQPDPEVKLALTGLIERSTNGRDPWG